MIIYDLNCENSHRFEGWFKNREDYGQQQQRGLLCCPVCESTVVEKVPTASRITTSKDKASDNEAPQPDMRQLLNQLHDYVDNSCENVGRGFADEARKIHYGETDLRNIRGEVTRSEAKELKEEGVPTLSLPQRPITKDKLN